MVSFFSAVVRSFGFSSTPTKWRVGTFHQWLRLQFGGLYRIQFEKWALEVLQWDQSSAVCLFQWDGLLLAHFDIGGPNVATQTSENARRRRRWRQIVQAFFEVSLLCLLQTLLELVGAVFILCQQLDFAALRSYIAVSFKRCVRFNLSMFPGL